MKRFITTILFVALTTVAAIAQTAPVPAAGPATDVKLIGFEVGAVVGYSLNVSTTVAGTSFGANLVVADNVTVGFLSAPIGGTTFNMLKLTYFLNQTLGFSTYIGSTGATAAGLGVFFNIGKNLSPNGLSSCYKIKLDYLFNTTGLSTGTVAVTAAMQLGI